MIKEYKKPKRFFEKSGFVNPEISYYVPHNVVNTDNQDIKTMIDQSRYFSIFSPRQSGKTTFFEMFCTDLQKDNSYIPILLSFQFCKDLSGKRFYKSVEDELYIQLLKRLKEVKCDKIEIISEFLESHKLSDHLTFNTLFVKLNEIIEYKKIVIFIDEFDGIPKDELENFLCVLRELYQGYKKVKQKALYSVGLVGIRNITKLIVGGVSPFNIADKVNIPPFTFVNIEKLYGQYTEETNQPFTQEATQKVYEETQGQPWLVNRIGTILTINVKPETTEPITEEDVNKAINKLLREHNSHFDNLVEKAKQFRDTFIEIVFNGVRYNPDDEAIALLELHGLIKEEDGKACVSNNIYKQRFINMFFDEVENATQISNKRHYQTNGTLIMEQILEDFEEYIMEIGVNAFYAKDKPYEKTGQFLLTAYLYQFISGAESDLRYESPTGLGKMDIMLTFKGKKYIIETKINRGDKKKTLDRAANQIADKYMKTQRANEGYVVIFDPKTQVGDFEPHQRIEVAGGKEVIAFNIGIGR